tara:strand:- start:142 stop:324 length:183 start_codon:yes stop_codon:yes gene_type:complete
LIPNNKFKIVIIRIEILKPSRKSRFWRYISKPVVEATGYKNITPTGVSGFLKAIIGIIRE